MNIIAWLRTPIATLIVLCAALLAQLPHAADVFRMIVGGVGWPAVLHGYAYAIALELAVLLFVVQRRDAESYLFACVSILVNLSYYALHGIHLFTVAALPAWLVSIALPAAIARYSHLLVEESPTSQPTATPPDAATAPPVAPAEPLDVAVPEPASDEQPATVAAAPAPARKPAQRKTQRKPAKLSAAQRQAQIASSGVTDPSAICAQFGVSLRTAQNDIAAVRKGLLTQNGATH